MSTQTIFEPARQIPVTHTTDVLVCGGGTAGIGAAIGAANSGASVLLVEKFGCLGGLATMGLITSFMSMSAYTGGRQIIKGAWEELFARMEQRGAAIRASDFSRERPGFHNHRHEPDTNLNIFDPECFKIVADELMEAHGVEVLYHTYIADTLLEDGRVIGVVIENKGGRQAILARRVVDATGDADVAARAGVPFQVGREKDGVTMPMTTMFCIGGVADDVRTHRWDNSLAMGAVNLFPTMARGEFRAEMTRTTNVNGLCAEDLTKAEIQCRRQIPQILEYLHTELPGAEHARLTKIASTVGVQDTRRIEGEYTLTEEDVLSYRQFPDNICVNGYGIDVHNPDGAGCELHWLIPGHAYGIPYRCLVPVGADALLVAGRCISANVSAQTSVRIMAACMAMGQAAGTAAALSIQQDVMPRELDIQALQQGLRAQNVYLGEEEPPVPKEKFIHVKGL